MLVALIALACAGCLGDSAERAPAPAAAPARPQVVQLREAGTPGARYMVAEVTTLERAVVVGEHTARLDVEVGKRVEVEVVQVEPDGARLRYRKRFVRYRQRALAQLDDGEPEVSAEVHPLEGRGVELVWRGARAGGWAARLMPASGEAADAAGRVAAEQAARLLGGERREHVLLPAQPVRVGERWRADGSPLSLPGVDEARVALALHLVELGQVEGRRVARVDVTLTIAPAPQRLSGALEGFYLFDVDEGRFLQVRLGGTLTARSEDGAVLEQLRVVTFRASEAAPR